MCIFFEFKEIFICEATHATGFLCPTTRYMVHITIVCEIFEALIEVLIAIKKFFLQVFPGNILSVLSV